MSASIGPNVRKLIAHKMSLIAIPSGSGQDAFAIGLNAISDRDRFTSIAKEARLWVENALSIVKTAPDNSFNDDEEIAGHLLAKIAERG